MQSGLIDAHLHLQDPRFSTARDEVINRAQNRGVTQLFCNAVNEADWLLIAELAKTYPQVIPFFGIHPWCADSVRSGWQQRLIETAETCTRFGGIGEAGLDKSCPIDFDVQKALFTDQLELAIARGWPLSVHCVKAWGPLLEILTEYDRNAQLPRLMIHAFSGSTEIMTRLTGLGCYISFAESLMHPLHEKIRSTFKETPTHLLLLETDAPYDKKPKKPSTLRAPHYNQPADVAELYLHAADLLSVPMQKLSSVIWKNAQVFKN